METVPREGYRLNLPEQRGRVFPIWPALFAAGAAAACAVWLLWPETLPAPAAGGPVAEAAPSPPGTASTEAFLEVLQGRASANRFSLAESLIAERHFRRAIDLDDGYARDYAELGTLLAVRFENDWTVLEQADREKSLFYANTAVELDPQSWLGHYALGRLHSVFSDLDRAEDHLGIAMSLEPGNEDARAYFGIVRNFRGETEEAVAILEQAVASHPEPPYWYYLGLGNALFNAGRNIEAIGALQACLTVSPDSPYCLRYLMAIYGAQDRPNDAERAISA